MYRATVRAFVRPGPAVLAAAAYGLGALTLWAFSEGRLGLLIALAVLPAAAERIEAAFAHEEPLGGMPRFVAGSAVTFAVGAAAYPGILLAIAVLIVLRVLSGPARRRGLLLTAAGAVGAAVLLFPFVPTLLRRRRSGALLVGRDDRAGSPGAAGARTGAGDVAGRWHSFRSRPPWVSGLVRGEFRGPAARATVAAGAGLILSWLAAANYLPLGLANPAGLRRAGRRLDGEPDRIRPHLVHRIPPVRVLRAPTGQWRGARDRPGCGTPAPVDGRHGRHVGRRSAGGTDPARVGGRERGGQGFVPRPLVDRRSRRRSSSARG